MTRDCSPLNDLYIYYIQGDAEHYTETAWDDFIGNWKEDNFSFLFFSRPSHDKVEKLLKLRPELILLDHYHMTYEEWQGGKVEPFKIGSFFISPPWNTQEAEDKRAGSDSEFHIVLDPGVVFGTGTHPTTRDCLELLEQVCSEENIETVLDLGTGTGLLAIAAASMGCPRTVAVDYNFLAAKTARKNTVLNRLEHKILVARGKAEDFTDYPADLFVANIHYDVMKHLVNSEGFLCKKWFILSGLLRSQARDVAFKLSQLPVTILKQQEQDGIWHTFLGRIKDF
ncbi:MAG: methyltransferase [Desulfobacterales bacterium]|nr:methyltransferase [Desulfobacterales bacterium]